MAKHDRRAVEAAFGGEDTATPSRRRRWWLWPLVLLSVLLVLVGSAVAVIYSTLGRAEIEPYSKEETYGGQDMLEHDLPPIDEEAVESTPTLPALDPLPDEEGGTPPTTTTPTTSATAKPPASSGGVVTPKPPATMQQRIRDWCANGEAVSSDHVINVLLVGIDSVDVMNNGRADSLILMSVNTQKKTITLTSLLRDQYAYITTEKGESFEKMHLSNVRGGPEKLIQTIEAHYKVQIDNYILVSLTTFPLVIDRVGGVTLSVTEAEAAVLGGEFVAGEQRLTGAKALRYARIRKYDSEQARTGRQRKVLAALVNELKSASVAEIAGVINDVLPYVRTGFTQTQMISLATRAVSEGWFGYAIQQRYTPEGDYWRGEMIDELWYWLVDYPVAAYELQMSIYGRSNIRLSGYRRSFLDYPVR